VAEDVRALRLGTRGSALALTQTELVKKALQGLQNCPSLEICPVKTEGDRHLELSLAKSGQSFAKGLFTRELESALQQDLIDLAVHSLKDLPTDLAPEFTLAAVLPRHNPSDVLVSKKPGGLAGLGPGAIIATSSPRRKGQLRFHRPDLEVVEVRGNVHTRLKKLSRNPTWSALVLARAGLERLGFPIDGILRASGDVFFASELAEMYPAVGQGTIAIEISTARCEIQKLLELINDQPTWVCISAEREFLRLVSGGCTTPIGVRSSLEGEILLLEAIIFEPNGNVRRGSARGAFPGAQAAAKALFESCYGTNR
jgi:hydroxymethylbilane synthase